jgi:SAM-dependent MidA family methyltransferase
VVVGAEHGALSGAAPERLDRFMARAVAAYYGSRDPFGAQGDFTTAPEISQAFGECLGLWAAVVWQQMGAPAPVLLVELGPGRGTLMADALRAAAMVPAFRAALAVHLVEQSPVLRQAQAARVPEATWHDGLATLPAGPAIVLGNEFLDALPIRQFVRRGDGWAERHVLDGAFVELPASHPALPEAAPEGAVQEVCEAALALCRALAERFRHHHGAALFLDYGPAASALGDSLQAMHAHGRAEPLAAPGSVDLTAHVDFAACARAARQAGAAAHGPLPQGVFLQRLGLVSRAAVLARSNPRQAGEVLSAAQRLVAPEAMGQLFKALCLCHAGLPTPPGFEAA